MYNSPAIPPVHGGPCELQHAMGSCHLGLLDERQLHSLSQDAPQHADVPPGRPDTAAWHPY